VTTSHLAAGEPGRDRLDDHRHKEIGMSDLAETADAIVVGGGSAGAVLAARLNQDPVRGVSGLRVADASIIPEIPAATTNVTVIMLAERIYQRVYAS
jgi:choline dehydrogenase-like flavoprotein